MPLRQFDLIAFDWDGTLFDSTAIITKCIQEAVRDVGGTVPGAEQAAYVIGMALMPALAHAAPDVPKEKYPELGARYKHHYMAHQHDISLFDGVLAMLADLKTRQHHLRMWPPAKAARVWMTHCTPWSSKAFSTLRARPMRLPANRTRACCMN